MENKTVNVHVDMNNIFREFKDLHKSNKRLTFIGCACVAFIAAQYSENKKQKEQIKALNEELKNLKGE